MLKVLRVIGLILLWILRIIGIILGLILLLVLLILFVPFRYKAEGNFDDGVDVKVKFSWLLHFVNGYYERKGDQAVTVVRVIFFKVYTSGLKEKSKDDKSKKEKTIDDNKEKSVDDKEISKDDYAHEAREKPSDHHESKATEDKQARSLEEDLASHNTGKKVVADNIAVEKVAVEKAVVKKVVVKEVAAEETVVTEKTKEEKTKEKSKEEKTKEKSAAKAKLKEEKATKKDAKAKAKAEKAKAKEDKKENPFIGKAKHLWAFLQEKENKGVLKFITKYVVKVLKWLLPRKLMVDMELGLEDPAITGYIAGVTSLVYVATKRNIHIEPNFNVKVLKGQFKIKGRLFLFQLVYYIIRVILDKRVRRLYKEIQA